MQVYKRMNRDVVTIHPTASVEDALHLMREKGIRNLPVLDHEGRLIGFVSETDLLLVSPSPVASLSVQDMMIELSRLRISEVMTREPFTIEADASLEEAAAIMIDNKISALPVLREGQLVGIITGTDIFRMFLEVIDAPVPGVSLTVHIPDKKGIIAAICKGIAGVGGSVLSLGMFPGKAQETRVLVMKVSDVTQDQMQEVVESVRPLGCEIMDMRVEQAAQSGRGETSGN